ncbi:deoxyguanosinetriphosphate triphosphohydrolase [Photobacterium iliopiscarium]|uniref:Deoxyguanosinetriphosphate triphosphohydrolase-like protein n=1 Tax=Photobacterium iliopiscarium TaxID=56192 RepID=A0ABX5GSU7_9GAMM|nr:anti-phage deoxyguanosine triphosphatase [Photobacterium iliopiscarium]KJG26002.1 deoxyguanosinetriphosphate triphosphohydrolase [Photobacterium iliopiscarium]PSW98066.1 dGTPase [Photobacterium iliopiscarium]
MTAFIIDPCWQQRHSDEQKMRRDDHRSAYQRDRARILHSAAFRRLQAKTQVHGAGNHDFYRTRLTHSLEASQIGTGIVAQLKLKQPQFHSLLSSTSLMESLCLAHDIGHPPFGHGGEVALNYMMRNHGGFEGNAQTFRIVTLLEPYTEHYGMNLSRRTLLGLLKYPVLLSQTTATERPSDVTNFRHLKAKLWHPAKGIYDDDKTVFDWVLAPLSEHDRQLFKQMRNHAPLPHQHNKTRFKSLDCSIMELADDIAYGVHDLEDAIVMGIVNREQWQEAVASKIAECGDPWLEQRIGEISEHMFASHHQRKDAIGALVNALLTSIEIAPTLQDGLHSFEEPLLKWNAFLSPAMEKSLNVLKQFVSDYVVKKPEIQLLEYKGQQLIMELFDAFASDPERLLPEATRQHWQRAVDKGDNDMRIIADYISSMTDGFSQRLYNTLFQPSIMMEIGSEGHGV